MELESYFDFLADGDIRIKGTRVYLEDVIARYFEGDSPEEIIAHFSTVTLEQSYATILYYLANRSKVDDYIKNLKEEAESRYQEYLKHPSELHFSLKKRIEALRQQKAESEESSKYQGITL